jgi:hypothetical protein
MATNKRVKSDPAFRAAIARVEPALAGWRQQRKTRDPIPEALWRRMAMLAGRYGLSPVAQALKVNYTGLKRHLAASVAYQAEPVRGVAGGSSFVELPLSGWPVASQWVLELEDGSGCKLTLRTTALGDSAAAMAIAQGLWSHRA